MPKLFSLACIAIFSQPCCTSTAAQGTRIRYILDRDSTLHKNTYKERTEVRTYQLTSRRIGYRVTSFAQWSRHRQPEYPHLPAHKPAFLAAPSHDKYACASQLIFLSFAFGGETGPVFSLVPFFLSFHRICFLIENGIIRTFDGGIPMDI